MYEYEPPTLGADTHTTTEHLLAQKLEETLYQFVTLHEEWSKERLVASERGAEFAKLIKYQASLLEKFDRLGGQVSQAIGSQIKNSAIDAAATVAKEVSHAATKESQATLLQLQNTVRDAENTLRSYRREVVSTHWKIIGFTVLTTILSVFLIIKFLVLSSHVSMTKESFDVYQSGLVLETAWPKLSKKEQERILKLANGKT